MPTEWPFVWNRDLNPVTSLRMTVLYQVSYSLKEWFAVPFLQARWSGGIAGPASPAVVAYQPPVKLEPAPAGLRALAFPEAGIEIEKEGTD